MSLSDRNIEKITLEYIATLKKYLQWANNELAKHNHASVASKELNKLIGELEFALKK